MLEINGHNLKTLSLALEGIADNVMITDKEGVIEYVNPAFEATTGYSRLEVVGRTPNILRSGAHGNDYYEKLWTTILSGGVFRATTTNKKKNGEVFYADQTISPVLDDDGEIVHFISIWKDATDRIQTEKKLKKLYDQLSIEKNKLEQVLGIESGLHKIVELHQLVDFVVEKTCEVVEADTCTIMFIDPETKELCLKSFRGIDKAAVGHKKFKLGDDIKPFVQFHCQNKECGQPAPNNPLKLDGGTYQSEGFLSVPIELKDNLLGLISVADKKGDDRAQFTPLDLKILLMIVRQVRIAIDNAKLYRDLQHASMVDAITNIYNYRYLSKLLDKEIARAKRYKRNLSFLMIDVDEFKTYNDKHGHLEGDELLKTIAKVIKDNIRSSDTVCRYAGDEFALVLPELDIEQAKVTSEKIRQEISEIKMKSPISVSIGAAQVNDSDDRHDLIRRADSHLYEAKHKGRNQTSG